MSEIIQNSDLQQQIEYAIGQGYAMVQEGRVLRPYDATCRVFAERVEGFDIGLLGRCGPPDWRSPYDNLLLDDEERWVHMRRARVE